MPLGRLFTVGGDDGRYRVLAQRDPRTGGTLIAAVPMREADQQLERLLVVEGIVIAAVLLLLGGAGWVVVRIGLLPLDRMGHTAGRIAGGDLSHRVEATDPRTEVGRLGVALNGMLDRLEDAFSRRQASEDRLRTFIADASHELRTPLASIRGYAELFRMGAVPEGPEQRARDAPHRGRGRAHGRARRGPADARAAGPGRRRAARRARRLARSPATPSTTRARPRPTARSRSPPTAARRCSATPTSCARCSATSCATRSCTRRRGRRSRCPSSRGADVVRVTVRDHGPGLPTDDADALFERFWRAEGGRERGKGGAGLGLAIVAGIVDAHDGRVRAGNADGGGAAFVVELPALRKL